MKSLYEYLRGWSLAWQQAASRHLRQQEVDVTRRKRHIAASDRALSRRHRAPRS